MTSPSWHCVSRSPSALTSALPACLQAAALTMTIGRQSCQAGEHSALEEALRLFFMRSLSTPCPTLRYDNKVLGVWKIFTLFSALVAPLTTPPVTLLLGCCVHQLLARMLVRVTLEVINLPRMPSVILTCCTCMLGPLVTQETGGYYTIIGVVSWGFGCAGVSRRCLDSHIALHTLYFRPELQVFTQGLPTSSVGSIAI